MFAKGKPVGVMLVNNYLSRRPITDRDQKLLTMLANQGGLSVETSRLYRHLEDANREMAAMRSACWRRTSWPPWERWPPGWPTRSATPW